MREIACLNDAARARETQTDFYTARIVAMLAAVNSKNRRYEPAKYMIHKSEIREKQREPMTGEQVLARFRQLGVPIIDQRANR